MSAEQTSATEKVTIYVALQDEGTEVLRPVPSTQLGPNSYRLGSTPAYAEGDEQWPFPPGTIVRCIKVVRDNGSILVAHDRATDKAPIR